MDLECPIETNNNKWERGTVIEDQFVVGDRIGKGGFGQVFSGWKKDGTENQEDKNTKEVAIKVEMQSLNRPASLNIERKILIYMRGGHPYGGFPQLKAYGQVGQDNYLVMDLLGPSVHHLFRKCSHRFTLKTLLLLTDQILLRVQLFHHQGFIHRDLKPENILMGRGKTANTLFLIDFGLAMMYINADTKEHIPLTTRRRQCGTHRFMSIHSHRMDQQSRRDDLESVVYILAHFVSGGNLPWANIDGCNEKQRNEKMAELKQRISAEKLFFGLPLEFAWFARTVRNLAFQETPEYTKYRKVFWNLAQCLGIEYDYGFDWDAQH